MHSGVDEVLGGDHRAIDILLPDSKTDLGSGLLRHWEGDWGGVSLGVVPSIGTVWVLDHVELRG